MNKPGKQDIYIIFEGPTEEKFIKKLQNNFETKYNLFLIDAKGKDNIINEYKKVRKKTSKYSEVAVMYDLDGIDTVSTILDIYNKKGISISKKNIFFINPQFELIFILTKTSKLPVDNYDMHIKKLFDIDHYHKKDRQLDKIIKNITKSELIALIDKMKNLLTSNDKELRSTNYDLLFTKVFKIRESEKTLSFKS